jgi:hypothetical protein
VWNSTFFSFTCIYYYFVTVQFVCHYLYYVTVFIFKVWFDLLTTCSIVAVSRCRFVIPETNIGGGARSCLSCLVMPSVFACRRGPNLLVVVNWVWWLFVSCCLLFSPLEYLILWRLFFSCLFRWLLSRITDSSLSSLLVLSSVSEKSAVGVSGLFVVAI